ncbi:PTS sugar transporter subunit IIA [Actinomadura sp. 7K534]|uniref:PTS sugar transporter subunit IIA n=1 Tax=Actinomadura sp. 7K534 TaxID=2530366 RepID=UPI00104608B1|nr:PTS sugar transporter subunit IIA [Actinomadura sp. 7K534]TDB96280.1 PTS sugar transporter subunit IIA [Actinomadura sp. 7K534]
MADRAAGLLAPEAIRLDARAAGRDDAVRVCGQVLVDVGAAEPGYIDAMLDRERSISTYLGEGVAIPHGTNEGRDLIRRDALAFVRFPEGADWNGEPVTVCIAIAARGDGHMEILTELAQVLMDPDKARELREADDPGRILALLDPRAEEEQTTDPLQTGQGHAV